MVMFLLRPFDTLGQAVTRFSFHEVMNTLMDHVIGRY